MGLKKITVDKKLNRKLYAFLISSCVITYALAITWSTPDKFIFWTNSLGVILQLVALFFLIKIMKEATPLLIANFRSWTVRLIFLSFLCFFIKILIQGFVAIPYLATVSYTIKNFVIGFMHLMNLGFVSLFFFAMIYQFSKLDDKLFTRGSKVFLFGFITTEFILFLQGFLLWFRLGFMPYYYQFILGFSMFLFLGVLLMFVSLYRKKDMETGVKGSDFD